MIVDSAQDILELLAGIEGTVTIVTAHASEVVGGQILFLSFFLSFFFGIEKTMTIGLE